MNVTALGRCIDQPILINKLQKKIPMLLVGSGALYGMYDTHKTSKGRDVVKKKETALKNAIIISSTIAASLAGAYGVKIAGKQIIPKLLPMTPLKEILNNNKNAVDKFIQETKPAPKIAKEVKVLLNELPTNQAKKNLLSVLLPESENLSANGIMSEIGRLSLLGAIPVVGGVMGGVLADKVTKSSSRKSTANKVKEGFYQYFANIFLCNVGAAAALFCAEGLQKAKLIKPLTPLKKMLVIMSGITATGIVGGSYIANKMSQKIIDPIFNNGKNLSYKGVYEERHPEIVDIALHADDIATAGVLSGFKWIEPALPLMYFVSGYRAGIGYRNAK